MLNRKHQSPKETHQWTSGIMLIIIFALLLGLTVLVAASLSPNSTITSGPGLIIVAVIASMLAIIAYCTLSNSQILNKLHYRIKQRENLIKLIASLCFSTLIAIAINTTAVSISEAQFELSNHTTLPNFELDSVPIDDSIELTLSSEIGSASHISATVKDHCYFLYKNTPCELSIDQPMMLCSGSGSIDSQERSVSFKPEYSYTNSNSAQKMIEAAVIAKFPDAKYISVDRYIDITFFDYQNQQTTYRFSTYDNQIELMSTTSSPIAKNNMCGMIFGDIAPYEKTVNNTATDLLEKFAIIDDQNAYY